MTQSVQSTPSNTDFELMKTQVVKLIPHLTCDNCEGVPNAENPKEEKFRCLNTSNAHLLCKFCKKHIAGGKCPVRNCGSKISKSACPLVSSLIEMLPFCCKYREWGCEEVLLQEEMKAHFSRCIFSEMTCINLDCEMPSMSLKLSFDHMPACSIIPEIENIVEIKLDDKCEHGTYWKPSLIQRNPLNKPLFYFFAEVDECDIVYAWIYFLGFKEDAERFTFSLEVNSKRSIKFTGPVKSIFEDRDEIIHDRDAFMIGVPIGKKLCNEQEKLEINVEIFNEKAEAKEEEEDSAISYDE